MKKILLLLFTVILLTCLFSCNVFEDEYEVTLVFGGGIEDQTLTVSGLGYLSKPKDPVRENYIFCGWYHDAAHTRAYDFSASVKRDLTLYAKWIPDYAEITNRFAESVISANIKLHVTHVKYIHGASTEYATGSGVIIKKAGSTCYALTNNHVVEAESETVSTSVVVSDVYGNESRAEILYKSAEYDLAIIRFSTQAELTAVNIENKAPGENEPVISLGNPNGIINVMTFGEIADFDTVGEEGKSATSHVDFPVIWHTADIDHGSSGGALFDLDFNLIGINYAVSFKNDESFAFGFAIPSERILEFLDLYF